MKTVVGFVLVFCSFASLEANAFDVGCEVYDADTYGEIEDGEAFGLCYMTWNWFDELLYDKGEFGVDYVVNGVPHWEYTQIGPFFLDELAGDLGVSHFPRINDENDFLFDSGDENDVTLQAAGWLRGWFWDTDRLIEVDGVVAYNL